MSLGQLLQLAGSQLTGCGSWWNAAGSPSLRHLQPSSDLDKVATSQTQTSGRVAAAGLCTSHSAYSNGHMLLKADRWPHVNALLLEAAKAAERLAAEQQVEEGSSLPVRLLSRARTGG